MITANDIRASFDEVAGICAAIALRNSSANLRQVERHV